MRTIPFLSLALSISLMLSCEKREPSTQAASESEPSATLEGGAVDNPPENSTPPLVAQVAAPEKPAPSPAIPAADKEGKAKGKANAKEKGVSLFNGKDLKGWKEVNFGGEGEVRVEDGSLILGVGESMTAVIYDGKDKLPTMDYEISLEANKLMGNDFFCGLTFPVRDTHATLIVGGWGGAVVGISSIDSFDASENETAQFMAFDKERWYKIRLRVADERIAVWIDDKEMTDVDIRNREVDMRPGEIELCVPLGIASYQTRSAVRNIRLKKLPASDDGF